jgi:signal peptidase I
LKIGTETSNGIRAFLPFVGVVSLVTILGSLLFMPRVFFCLRTMMNDTMSPTIHSGDRILVEKLPHSYTRGEIIAFYPPFADAGLPAASVDPLEFLFTEPKGPVYVRRIIGLPGERIEVLRGKGVAVNGAFLEESEYSKVMPDYDLSHVDEIGGHMPLGELIHPYPDSLNKPIVVPPGALFVLGDNRSASEDSHVFGFVDERRVIGRVRLTYLPDQKLIALPAYHGMDKP